MLLFNIIVIWLFIYVHNHNFTIVTHYSWPSFTGQEELKLTDDLNDEEEDEEEEDEETNYADEVVGDDEDVVNEDAFYMQQIENRNQDQIDQDDDEEDEQDSDDEYDMTALESYTTPLDGEKTKVDEYEFFRQCMLS